MMEEQETGMAGTYSAPVTGLLGIAMTPSISFGSGTLLAASQKLHPVSQQYTQHYSLIPFSR